MDFETSFDMEQTLRVFETGHDFALQIDDQNKRFLEACELFHDDPEIKDITIDGIAEEQSETFAKLCDLSDESGFVYENLGKIDQEIYRKLVATSDQVVETNEEIELKKNELTSKKTEKEEEILQGTQDIVSNVARLSPKSLEKVKEILRARTAEAYNDEDLKNLQVEIGKLTLQLEMLQADYDVLEDRTTEIDNLISSNVNAWPLPLAVIARSENASSLQAIIDELPVEPELTPRVHERYVKLKSHNIDQPEATIYTALYFSEHAAKTVTVDELIDFLYSQTVIATVSNYHMRTRVTTILGPERGVAVRQILQDEGFLLQYGWRRTLEKNGNGSVKVIDRKRIYRAIALADLANPIDATMDGNDFKDNFEISPEMNTLITAAKNDLKHALETPAVATAPTYPTLPETAITTQQPKMQNTNTGILTAHTTGNYLPKTSQEAPRKSRRSTKVAQTPTPRNFENIEAERTVTWEKEFQKEVGKTIVELEKFSLLITPEGESLGTARRKGAGTRVFSNRMLEKLAEAGLITKDFSKYKSNIASFTVTPDVVVMLKLFSVCSDLAKGNPHQNRAKQIIQEAVTSFFEHRQDK
ncbi:MAG: hypothetical protein NVS1B7_4850 [Candidatus Saccharimonadales bacterium]